MWPSGYLRPPESASAHYLTAAGMGGTEDSIGGVRVSFRPMRGTAGLRPSVESDPAAGVAFGGVGRVVGSVVMVGAKQLAVGEVGAPASGPGGAGVVGLAPRGRDVTALGAALAVAEGEGAALGAGEEALGAAEVEDLALAVEHRGDDGGRAR